MNRDERVLRQMLATFRQWRVRSPTLTSLLFSRRSLAIHALYGACTAAVVCFFVVSAVSPEHCYVAVGMFVSAMAKNAGTMRSISWNWRIQESLMDWSRIDGLARELGISE